MALFAEEQDESIGKPTNIAGLPALKDAAADVKTTGKKAQGVIAEVGAATEALTAERVMDAQQDLEELKTFNQEELIARDAASTERAKFSGDVNTNLNRLAKAQAKNPFVRSLEALIRPSKSLTSIRSDLDTSMTRLNVFSQNEAARQKKSGFALNSMLQEDVLQEKGFALREEQQNQKLQLAQSNARIAKSIFDTGASKARFQIESMNVQRSARTEVLTNANDADILQWQDIANASDTGIVDAGNGVFLSKENLKVEQARRVDVQVAQRSAIRALEAKDQEAYLGSLKQVTNGLTMSELEAVAANNFTIEGPDGQPLVIPPALVQGEIARRGTEQQDIATRNADQLVNEAEARVSVEQAEVTINTSAPRVASFFGPNSKTSRDLGFSIAKMGASLDAITAGGPATPQAVIALGKVADKGLAKFESDIVKASKQAFPKNEPGAASLEGYLTGGTVDPVAALNTLVHFAIGTADVPSIQDPKIGEVLKAVDATVAQYLSSNLGDGNTITVAQLIDPQTNQLRPDAMQQLMPSILQNMINGSNGKVTSEHQGLLQKVSAVAYDTWRGLAANDAFTGGIDNPESPAFGQITSAQVLAAITAGDNLQARLSETGKGDDELADVAAEETMRILRSIRTVSGKDGSQVFMEHLQSDAFIANLRGISEGQEAGFLGFLVSKGAAQGSFTPDMLEVAQSFAQADANGKQKALSKQAELLAVMQDSNDSGLLALTVAGFLEGDADSEAVRKYTEQIVNQSGGDFEQVWALVNQSRAAMQSDEKIRKSMVGNMAKAENMLGHIFSAFQRIEQVSPLDTNPAIELSPQPNDAGREAQTQQQKNTIFPRESN